MSGRNQNRLATKVSRMEQAMRSILHSMSRVLPLLMAIMGAVGCASFSNPTTFPSIPVRRLPDEVLGKAREEQIDIPYALLRQKPPDKHIIDVGDTLGVLLEGIIGPKDGSIPAPVYPPVGSLSQNIGVGFPIPVLDDGTISLPNIDPVKVQGLTLPEAQKLIGETYLEKGIIKEESKSKVLVTLFRARLYHVLIVRQDSGGAVLNPGTGTFNTKRGSGAVLDLPAYENDVLTALTRSGGLPGLDAKNEVVILRGNHPEDDLTTMTTDPIPGITTTRIPLRLRPGEPIPFRPEDVILRNGDIVKIESRDTEVFYTGGLILPAEWPIPRDYDLDVLTAVMQTHGPLANGGVNTSNLSGALIAQGIGAPSPSQLTVLRRAPGKRQITIRVDLNRAMQDPRERILVQPGDVLILQETMGESFTRYATSVIKTTFVWEVIRSRFFNATTTGTLP